MALDENFETFIIHVIFFNLALRIYPNKAAKIAFLLKEKVKILDKFSDFANIFLEEKALVLLKCLKLNEHAIDLINGTQPSYRLIYSLDLIELEILKTFIETHLKSGFIWPSKSPASVSILFNKKPDYSFHLYIDYRDLNNLTIKNWYPLFLIRESFHRLGQTKRFT